MAIVTRVKIYSFVTQEEQWAKTPGPFNLDLSCKLRFNLGDVDMRAPKCLPM